MMNHRGYAEQSGAPASHFIGTGETINATGNTNCPLSGGVLSGDLAIAVSCGVNYAFLSTLVGNLLGPGYAFGISRRVLDATDQSNQSVLVQSGTNATTLVGIYRGPTTATWPTYGFNDNTTSSPVTCPGLTKNVGALALAYFLASMIANTFSSNPGTLRAVSSDGRVALADFDPASLYTNGTSETWSYLSLANILMPALDLH